MEKKVYNNISTIDRVQDIIVNHLKLKVNITFKKKGRIITNFEPSNKEYVLNKYHLDTELSKIEGHISFTGKNYTEKSLQSKI